MKYTIALTCHPSVPCQAIRRLEVSLQLGLGELRLDYLATGDIDAICIPNHGPSHRADGLWQYTCFEAFIKVKDSLEYYEFNFSPSTAWAVYHFDAYRQGMSVAEAFQPAIISAYHSQHQLKLEASIRLATLFATEEIYGLALGLSTVIQEKNYGLSYWACAHPTDRPDFHHPDSFALQLGRLPTEN